MKIKMLTATGVKGLNFNHYLDPVTVFTGRNFSGKTARLDAIRLGLLGHLPELGRRLGDVQQIAAQKSLNVALTMEDGSIFRCSAGKKLEHSKPFDVPAVLIDPKEYFALGDKDRVRYVFGLAQLEAPEQTVEAILSNIKQIKLDPHTEHHETVVRALVDEVDQSDRDRNDNGVPIQEWVEQLIVSAREKLKTAKATADRMAKTTQGLTQITAQEDEGFMADVTAKIKACDEDIGALNEQVGAARGSVSAINNYQAMLRNAERQVELNPDQTAKIEELQQEIKALTREGEYASQSPAAQRIFQTANTEHVECVQMINSLRSQINELQNECAKDLQQEACPVCEANHSGWQDKIKARSAAKVSAKRGNLNKLEEDLPKLVAAVEAAKLAVSAAQVADKTETKRVEALAKLRQSLHSAKTSQQTRDSGLKSLAELVAPESIDIESVNAKITDLTNQIEAKAREKRALQERQRAYEASQQDAKRAAQSVLEYELAKAEVEVRKLYVDLLEALQVELVKKAFGAILGIANRVTQGILRTPLAYCDGEIGRYEGRQWISHRTFSGTEKAIAYAGIAYALAAQSPVKIILVDELGVMEVANKLRLVERLRDLAREGVIDQAVVVDVDARPYLQTPMDGVTIIPLDDSHLTTGITESVAEAMALVS